MSRPVVSVDEGLRPFATERQAEIMDAVNEHRSYSEAARQLGIHGSAVTRAMQSLENNAARQGYAPDYDMHNRVAPGYAVTGTSTLYNNDGKVTVQWVKTQVDRETQNQMMEEAAKALAETVEPVPPTVAPGGVNDQLLCMYPVGDHHFGMLSWAPETGEDYDIKRGEELLIGAMDYLVNAAPTAQRGVIALMGDFLHYDSYESVTPTNRNALDSDTRFPRMVRAAMRTTRFAIDRALRKHALVDVVIVSGNHDPASMAFLREAIKCLYENEGRVRVDDTPAPFHYLRHGKCMFGFHHGDKVKMEHLPLIMATDQPQDWGATKHRYIYTGHIHHDRVRDFNGSRVEALRILPPVDAYAHGLGYRSMQDMKRIDFHQRYGEVGRVLVTPAMMDL